MLWAVGLSVSRYGIWLKLEMALGWQSDAVEGCGPIELKRFGKLFPLKKNRNFGMADCGQNLARGSNFLSSKPRSPIDLHLFDCPSAVSGLDNVNVYNTVNALFWVIMWCEGGVACYHIVLE